MEQGEETHQNVAILGFVGKTGRLSTAAPKGSCFGKEEKLDHPRLVVSHRPFSGCAPPKHTGICLTLAFQEVSGAKNMIKSNMCLRAFLDQSPVTESLPAGREGTAASSPAAPAAPFPCSVLPPGRQKRSLNPHIQRNLE